MSFDPSKVTPEDVPNLTEEEINQYEAYLEKTEGEARGTEAGEAAGSGEQNKVEQGSEEAVTDEVVVEGKPEGSTEGANPSAGATGDDEGGSAPQKFADKFETPEELVKGVENEIQALNLNPDLFKGQIEAAKASGDYKAVEDLYRGLGAEVTKRQAAAPPPAEKPREESTDLSDDEVRGAVMKQTYQQIAGSQTAAEMAKDGVELPKTQEEFASLRQSSPYWALRLEQEFRERFEKNLKVVNDYRTASRDVVSHNSQMKEKAKGEIKSLVIQKYGAKLSDQDLDTFVNEAVNQPTLYESRNGVSFLREGAILSHFIDTKMVRGNLLDEIIKERENQAVANINRTKKKPHETISRSSIAGSGTARSKGAKVDLNNPEETENLSDEQIEAIYEKKR